MEINVTTNATIISIHYSGQPSTFNLNLYSGWQWRNFFIPHLCQLFSGHVVGQALRNVCYCDITFFV